MKTIRCTRGLVRFAAYLLAGGCTATGIAATVSITLLSPADFQSVRFQTPAFAPDGSLPVTLEGADGKYNRIDFSTDLAGWRPLAILNTTSGPTHFEESLNGTAARYYRALQVEPELLVFQVVPSSASAGSVVEIDGQFFKAGDPSRNRVTIGGMDAIVLAATATRLTVRVPSEAQSGCVQVTTPETAVQGPDTFVVLASVAVQVQPPGAGDADDYVVVNSLGGDETNRVSVRKGMPLLTMAAPESETNLAVLYAVTVDAPSNLVLNAASTAEALVFMHPAFTTTDPLIAQTALAIIHTNAEVATLAQVIEQIYPQGGNPLASAAFEQAYSNALISVASSGSMTALAQIAKETRRALASAPKLPSANAAASAGTGSLAEGDYPLDLDWIEITRFEGGDPSVLNKLLDRPPYGKALGPLRRRIIPGQSTIRPYYTTVDWFVEMREVDVDRAFPEGRTNFNYAFQQKQRLHVYPLKENGFTNNSAVRAVSFTGITSLPGKLLSPEFYAGELFTLAKDALFPPDSSIRLPNRDGIYLVRAFGPSLTPRDEANFVSDEYPEEGVRVLALNLVNGVFEAIGVGTDTIGLSTNEADQVKISLGAKLTKEAVVKATSIHSSGDLLPAVMDLVKFYVTEYGKEFAKAQLKEAKAKVGVKGLEALVDTVKKSQLLKALELGGKISQLALRIEGAEVTTPMETAFIVIGDPFKLEILEVQPAIGGPGREVTIRFRGPPTIPRFNPATGDIVNFEGPELFNGVFLTATGPDTNGEQSATIKIPENLPLGAYGTNKLFVNASGRRGESSFVVESRPFVRVMSPDQGFAPSPSFLGAPFGGGTVRLTGVNFNATDKFFFFSTGGGVEATTKVANADDGDVTLTIPSGAQSGPIRVVHTVVGGGTQETNRPNFTVLAGPLLLDVNPTHGPVGTMVDFYVFRNGPSAATIAAAFSGAPFTNGLVRGEHFLVSVPFGTVSGPVTIATPAGTTTTSFTVDEGLSDGGVIDVGGGSIVTLARALSFASGSAVPDDDLDVVTNSMGDVIAVLDPPFEEGDFVTDRHGDATPRFPVGAAFKDSISIASSGVTGDGVLTSDFDTIAGGQLNGNLIVSGNHNTIAFTIHGTLTILGDHNYIKYCTFTNASSHGLVIRGNYNFVEMGTFQDNGGDGVLIEGGKFNTVSVAHSTGNGGNGVTLTGGAEGNTIRMESGLPVFPGEPPSVPGSGNRGHGVALLGSASNNVVEGLSSIAGNDVDGVYLDGSGVTRNHFGPLSSDFNGRNGVTVTNGAIGNEFGTVSPDDGVSLIYCEKNTANGIAIHGVGYTKLAVNAVGNGGSGVLLSGVTGSPGSTEVVAKTGYGVYDGPNGRSGVRLENGTTAVKLDADLNFDVVGLEAVGDGVRGNLLLKVSVTESVGNGIVFTNASENVLVATVLAAGGNGIVFSGINTTNNSVRIYSIGSCAQAGVLVTDGARDNGFTRAGIPHSTGLLLLNTNGLVIEGGAKRNLFDNIRALFSGKEGAVLRGTGTEANRLARCDIRYSNNEGVVIRDGASYNIIGGDVAAEPGNPFSIFPLAVSILGYHGSGVRVADPGTTGNIISLCTNNSLAPIGFEPPGIVVADQSSFTMISSNTFAPSQEFIVVSNAARRVFITGHTFDSTARRAIFVTNATDVTIGGPNPADGNTFTDQPIGIEISGPGTTNVLVQYNRFANHSSKAIALKAGAHDNLIRDNVIDGRANGIILDGAQSNRISLNTIRNQGGIGVLLRAGSSDNEVANNLISNNGYGVAVAYANSLRNRILQNSITANEAGIRLIAGGNKNIQPPRLSEFSGVNLFGEADAPDGSTVEVFRDPDDEGEVYLGDALVAHGMFRLPLSVDPLDVGRIFQLNATVTDPDGNTSEFSRPSDDDHDRGALTKLVWTSTRDGNPEIYLLDPPNAMPLRLTTNSAADTQPKLSPDGTNVIFVSTRGGNRAVYKMEAKPGATPLQLTTDTAADYDAAWSPGGDKIAFTSERGGGPAIYLMNADGSSVTRLLAESVAGDSPAWSPDGSKLAFALKTNGQSQIAIVNADGTGLINVSSNAFNDTQPVWSTNGETLLFVSDRDGNREIYSMHADGSAVTRLTMDPATDQDPAWLPGGKEFIFTSDRAGSFELYVLSASGGSARRFSVSAGDNTQPHAVPQVSPAMMQSADLAVIKLDAPASITVGSNLTYTITVSNAGPSIATEVTVTNTLPSGVTFVSAENEFGSCTVTGGVVACIVDVILSGAIVNLQIVVTPTTTGSITNTAEVTSRSSDPVATNNTAKAVTEVIPLTAELSITKVGTPASVSISSNLTYTITVTNRGPLTATNVMVEDALPAGASFVSASNSAGGCAFVGGVVHCGVATLPASASATIKLVITASMLGTITNLAHVTNAVVEFNLADNSATATNNVVLPAGKFDLGDALDSPGSAVYPTLLAHGGPYHLIVPGFHLGALIDAETDGQPNATATGDDTAGVDDEDGVVFLTTLVPGMPAMVSVTASASGYLNAWIDFNGDGDWDEPGEHIFSGMPLSPGSNTLSFAVPGSAVNTGTNFARFRFSTVSSLGYGGPAPDGEVEDCKVRISSPYDFGDAPDSPYPTLLAHGGAYHFVVPGIHLGALIDGETNGLPNATATGDDLDETDDDDGVVFSTPLTPGMPATIVVTASSFGYLNAWIDFNGDGDWDDSGEHIFAGTPLSPGTNTLSFPVPPSAMPGTTTFARFRFSTVSSLSYGGPAPNGEVEDYKVKISSPYDFGDAPDSPYPTLFAHGGAYHFIVPGIHLGMLIDGETNGLPNATATGDDLDEMDDEDGVVFSTPLTPGMPATISVTASSFGYLNAWIDFNGDGDWDDPAEHIFSGMPLSPGTNTLIFPVPGSALNTGTNFARFRFSTAASLGYGGPAPDGEVEDYKVTIATPPLAPDLSPKP